MRKADLPDERTKGTYVVEEGVGGDTKVKVVYPYQTAPNTFSLGKGYLYLSGLPFSEEAKTYAPAICMYFLNNKYKGRLKKLAEKENFEIDVDVAKFTKEFEKSKPMSEARKTKMELEELKSDPKAYFESLSDEAKEQFKQDLLGT